MIKKRLLSLFIACFMLFPFAMAFADGDSSGESRTGDTVTWIAGSGGGIAGYSDTTTIDDVDGDSLGINSTLNTAFKSKDHIEDQIGDYLGSHGDLQLSHVFWDGVHGRYINVEQYGYTLEQLLYLAHIANEYLDYQADAEHTIHLVDDIIEEAEDKKDKFAHKLHSVNLYPDEITFPGDNGTMTTNYDVKPPDLSDFLDKMFDFFENAECQIEEGLKPRVLKIVKYEDLMKQIYGDNVFNEHPEWKLTTVCYCYPARAVDGIEQSLNNHACYPAKQPPIFYWNQEYKTLSEANFGWELNVDNYLRDNIFSGTTRYADGNRDNYIDFYVFGYDSYTIIQSKEWASQNYHVLKRWIADKYGYDPYSTVVSIGYSYVDGTYMDYTGFYIFDVDEGKGETREKQWEVLQPLIVERATQLWTNHKNEMIKQINNWAPIKWVRCFTRGLAGDNITLPEGARMGYDPNPPEGYETWAILLNAVSNPYGGSEISEIETTYVYVPIGGAQDFDAMKEAIDAYNEELRASILPNVQEALQTNADMLAWFMEHGGSEVPPELANIDSGYDISTFTNILPKITSAAQTALQAIIAQYAVPEGLEGGTPQEILDALVSGQIANAEAAAGANQAALDAAQGEAIAEMVSGITNPEDLSVGGEWPGLAGTPEGYDYEQAIANLMATFDIPQDQIGTFVQNLLDTIESCNEESFAIDGLGPGGKIIDYETKEARYLALQAYLLMMCARDTINVQHIIVAEGNSYINNCVMSQSPIQFPAQMTGGLANYCWAIECIDSPYKEDIGNFTTMATYGNQLQYRFTSPGKYRIVATQNMLNNIESVVAMDFHEYWIIEETGQVIYSRIIKGHVNTVGGAQFSPAGRKGDDVCLYFNRRNEQTCYMDCDENTGIPGTVVYEILWEVTGDVIGIPPAGAFGTDSTTRQTG